MRNPYCLLVLFSGLIIANSAFAMPIDISTQAGTAELRQKLIERDQSIYTDGVVFWTDEKGDSGSYKLENYEPQRASLPDINELISNNKKIPIKERIDSELYDRINSGADTEEVEIIVIFVDDVPIPMLVPYHEKEPDSSVYNLSAKKYNEETLDILSEIRKKEVRANLVESGVDSYELVDMYSIVNGAVIRTNVENVKRIVKQDNVQYVSLSNKSSPAFTLKGSGFEKSPTVLANNISDARALIKTDPYYSLGTGSIAQLDGGADNTNHWLLRNRYNIKRDCYHGTAASYCASGTNYDPNDGDGHASAVGSIMSGTPSLGNPSQGVTYLKLDSYKIDYLFGPNDWRVSSNAVVKAYDALAHRSAMTVIAEMQQNEPYNGTVSTAANNAFQLGYATIAAAGNAGSADGSIRAPGNAQKVLAVGAYNVNSPYALMSYSSRGPTSDGRMKPELAAPTLTRAADIFGGNDSLNPFDGTSGAAPYAAGAAALFRSWNPGTSNNNEPGAIYASLINAATARQSTAFNNNEGAGRLRLPLSSRTWTGKVTVNQSIVSVPIPIGNYSYQDIAVTIWWPESPGQTHKVFRMGIRNYTCGSWSGYWPAYIAANTWQKYVINQQCSGNWYINIIPENSVNRDQVVYYSVIAYQYGH